MKTPLILLILLALTGSRSQAQDEPFETIFQRKANRQTSSLKGYGMVLTEFSPGLNSDRIKPFLSNGVEGGVVVNRRVRIGAYGLYNTAPTDILKTNPYAGQNPIAGYLQIGASAAWLPAAEKPLHLALGSRLGYGGALLNYLAVQPDGYKNLKATGVLVTPYADLEANLRPWLRASLGVGYRWAFGNDTPEFRLRQDLSGPVVQFSVHFGNFK